MRTSITLLVLSLLASTASAQSILTNGEIYDYQVGDVFQTRGQSANIMGQQAPPGIYTDTILSREEIDGGTGILYTMKHWHVAYQFMQAPVVTSSIDTLIVTDLDLVPDTLYSFLEPADTLMIYNPMCGLVRWEHYEGAEENLCWRSRPASAPQHRSRRSLLRACSKPC